MAGAITHLLVSEKAADDLPAGSPLRDALSLHRSFLFLGSVSPDLPYSEFLSRQTIWADRMHYVSTNQVALLGAKMIREKGVGTNPWRGPMLAWLAGYVAHCVTDATIHPIVQSIVGPYSVDPDRHRICETIQDTLLFGKLKGRDLRETHFVQSLKGCLEPNRGNFDAVVGFWFSLLVIIYNDAPPKPALEDWYQAYKKMIYLASDSELINALSRPFSRVEEYLYMSIEALEKDRAQEALDYYEKVPVPNRPGAGRRPFKEIGFDYAVHNVGIAWKSLMDFIEGHGDSNQSPAEAVMTEAIRNWNLDTGVDMAIVNASVSLWSP